MTDRQIADHPRLACIASAIAVVVLLVGGAPSAATPDVRALLDRYVAGDFSGVAAALEQTKDFNALLKQLKSDGPKWIAARGPAEVDRRELAAATFALEAGRAGSLGDWKLVQNFIRLENIYWRAPAQLVEWGCTLLRARQTPRPIERTWHLASVAVVDRVGDFEFLIGSPFEGRANPKDEIKHLEHAATRFPQERRFALAQGIAIEWRLFPNRRSGAKEAQQVFESLVDDEWVGAEASVRLGYMTLRSGSAPGALRLFDQAEQRTREPYVVFLARYFRGLALERQQNADSAERAYRGALAVVPGAQSASFSLAALLARRGSRAEAATFVDSALNTSPRPVDPWRAYGEADARFWPQLIAELHAEIKR